jgi:arylsulfatase A-like enzyme
MTCLLPLLLLGPAQAPAKAERPNVVLINADDLGVNDLGCYGRKDHSTPHLDRLASQGLRFTSAYCAQPICSPSRAALMTGKAPARLHLTTYLPGRPDTKAQRLLHPKMRMQLPLEERTVAEVFKDAGYATACVGKWHLGGPPEFLPTKRGFDEFYGTVANTPFFNPPNFVDSRVSDRITPVKDENFYTTDAYAERSVDWLGKQQGKPFFLYLPFNAQHAPLQAPKKYLDRFPGIKDEKRQLFAAMMSAMDDAVGRVLAKVKEMGQEENTLVVFFSDNGGPTPQTTSDNGPLRGRKATTSEGGTRIPFCVQWKGTIPAGKVYDHPIIQLDLLPTVLTAAGGKVEPDWKLDGVDLLPYLTGKNAGQPHETLYWRFGPQWAIRKGDWKLVASSVDMNKPRLINLKDDIAEAKDLSEENPDKVKELKADWDKWNAEQMAPRWVPAKKKAKK